MDDELLAYYDEIRRLAEAKSDSREEAEDLLSETFLAAFAYRHNGGVIEHPKTYLVHTLMHKRNSLLRRKYRLPKVVSLQTLPEDAEAFVLKKQYRHGKVCLSVYQRRGASGE